MATASEQFRRAVADHADEFGLSLEQSQLQRLSDYYDLMLKWNPRLHLVAPCSPGEFAVRHVLESLMLLKHLPINARVADVASGGGLPIVPCLLARDDLAATLIESSHKKIVFLREAVRQIKPSARVRLLAQRFEETAAPDVDFITCRALDRFSEQLPILVQWARPAMTFLFLVGEALRKQLEASLDEVVIEQIPNSERRFLVIGRQR